MLSPLRVRVLLVGERPGGDVGSERGRGLRDLAAQVDVGARELRYALGEPEQVGGHEHLGIGPRSRADADRGDLEGLRERPCTR